MSRAAITAPTGDGLSVLEASAGTGKTWTVAHLVSLWLAEGRLERLDEVVLVTFTEAAAGELAQRVRGVLAGLVARLDAGGPPPASEPGVAQILETLDAQDPAARERAVNRLRLALDEADRLLAGTLHAFCRRVLSDEAFLCGMPPGFTVRTDTREAQERALADAWRQGLQGDALAALAALEGGWSLAKDQAFLKAAGGRRAFGVEPALDYAQELARWEASLRALEAARAEVARGVAQAREFLARGSQLRDGCDAVLEEVAAWAAEPAAPGGADAALRAARRVTELPGLFHNGKGPKPLKEERAAWSAAWAQGPAALAARAATEGPKRLAWAWTVDVRRRAAEAYARDLRAAHALDFDGLIEGLRRALDPPASPLAPDLRRRLRSRWRVAIIDESQDTDPAQWEIFRTLFAEDPEPGRRLVLVGDPKQAIYSFRGADLETYFRARDLAGETLELSVNHRSAPGLVRALNALWARAEPALGEPRLRVPATVAARTEEDLPLPAGRARLTVAWVDPAQADRFGVRSRREENAAAATASAILRALAQGVAPRDCAVLVQRHAEARAVQAALAASGVPAVVLKSGDVFGTDTCDEWCTLLAALAGTPSLAARRAALATRLIGLDEGDLLRLTPEAEDAWTERLGAWARVLRDDGPSALLRALEDDGQARGLRALAALPDGARRVTDLRHLLDLCEAQRPALGRSPEALLAWLNERRAAADDDLAPEAHVRRLESDAAAVQVATMHAAKGLEFDHVFCPSLALAPSRPSDVAWTDGEDGRRVAYARALLAPERKEVLERRRRLAAFTEGLRLAYVALTRARRSLWVLAGAVGYGKPTAALPPTALDWLLRDGAREDARDPAAWFARMEEAKRRNAAAACEQRAGLDVLAAELPGLLAVEELSTEPGRWAGATAEALPPLRRALRPVPPAWGRMSYSAWVRDAEDAAEGAATPAPRGAGDFVGPLESLGLPGGTATGNTLHWLLERWDLRTDPEPLAAEALARFGVDLADHEVPASRRLADALAPLGASRLERLDATLGEAAGDPRRSEWRFLLPVGPRGLSGEDLRALFQAHGDAAFRAYGASLAVLPERGVRGLLEGSLDRLAVSGGRWMVLDWKSNRLDRGGDDPEALWRLACEDHYVLQMCLYLVAARRHLRVRDPAARLEGGALVFLRAVEPGTARGVLEICPGEGLLEALERRFLDGEGA